MTAPYTSPYFWLTLILAESLGEYGAEMLGWGL